jgi:hypothetical protein
MSAMQSLHKNNLLVEMFAIKTLVTILSFIKRWSYIQEYLFIDDHSLLYHSFECSPHPIPNFRFFADLVTNNFNNVNSG